MDHGAATPRARPEPTRAERRRATRRRTRRLRLQGLVLAVVLAAALFAAPRALLASEARVTIEVDGAEHVRTTRADSVAELLAEERIELGEFDRVQPPGSAPLEDGAHVRVFRGCLVYVDIEGEVEERGVTCDATADEMIRELGLDPDLVRTSRDERVGPGDTITMRAPRQVTLEIDGEERTVLSTALTVGELITELELELGPEATVEPERTAALEHGSRVVVQRGGDEQEIVDEPVPFETIRREDPYLEQGKTRLVREGQEGVRRIVRNHRVGADGVFETVVLSDEVVREPVAEVVAVGTATPPTTAPALPADVEQGGATWYRITPGTCAHKTLPMGTVVTVTNNASGATTTCTVADRGPFAAGRILDLAVDVFEALAPISSGVISVTATW